MTRFRLIFLTTTLWTYFWMSWLLSSAGRLPLPPGKMTWRQTGTVVQFAVAFQTIFNTFNPQWTDSAAIYVFSRKIKEQIRYLVAGKGNVPTNFQAYIAAAMDMEANLAAGKHRNPQQQQQQQPQRQQNNNPGRQTNPRAQNLLGPLSIVTSIPLASVPNPHLCASSLVCSVVPIH